MKITRARKNDVLLVHTGAQFIIPLMFRQVLNLSLTVFILYSVHLASSFPIQGIILPEGELFKKQVLC